MGPVRARPVNTGGPCALLAVPLSALLCIPLWPLCMLLCGLLGVALCRLAGGSQAIRPLTRAMRPRPGRLLMEL